jgi:hypothetical protein
MITLPVFPFPIVTDVKNKDTYPLASHSLQFELHGSYNLTDELTNGEDTKE